MTNLLDDVLRVATVADVFRLAAITPPTDPRKNIRCPLPDHNDGTASFHIQPSGKGFKCFGCGREGGLIELALALGVASTKSEALGKLADLHRIAREESSQASRARQYRAAFAVTLLPPEVEPELNEERRQQLRRALAGCVSVLSTEGEPGAAYLHSRGIPADAADVNDVRFHPDWIGCGPAIVFAVRDRHGKLCAAQGRYIDPQADPKARSLGDIGNGVYATSGALLADVVAITEAPLDALSIAINQLPALALCGTALKPWLRRHLKFRRIIIATDNDAAGDAAAETLRTTLSLSTCERFTFPLDIKDANEWRQCDPETLVAQVQAVLLGSVEDVLEPDAMPSSVISLDERRKLREAQPQTSLPSSEAAAT